LPVVLALSVGLCTEVYAQPVDERYESVVFWRVSADKDAAFAQQDSTLRDLILREMQEQPGLLEFSVRRLLYPGDTEYYNFTTVASYQGPPATGRNYLEYLTKAAAFGTRIGGVLYRVLSAAPENDLQRGFFVRERRWKIVSGLPEYRDFVLNTVFPVERQRVRDGVISGFTINALGFPGGSDRSYDATTQLYYKDLNRALTVGGVDAPSYAKVYPSRSYAAFVDQSDAVRKNIRSDVYEVVALLRRP
jgi:hypothetical protein